MHCEDFFLMCSAPVLPQILGLWKKKEENKINDIFDSFFSLSRYVLKGNDEI